MLLFLENATFYAHDSGLTGWVQSSPLSKVPIRFVFLKQSLVAAADHPEHFLKEKIVWNLNYGAAILPYDDEHEIAVDHPAPQVLGHDFDIVAEMKGAPKGNKKACRYVADHCPSRQETNPDDGRGAYQKCPKSANANAPDFQHQHRNNDPQRADQKARRCQYGLVR